jgi:ketosteroid isomerase-like protein
MHPNALLIHRFYEAFDKRDYKTMQALYHPEASFSDPVFPDLPVNEVKAMWKMLTASAKDLEVTFKDVQADDRQGSCHWEARYTFTGTGRKVHNVISAEFQFAEGKIIRHTDQFNFWRWSRMALGNPGLLLGWTPYLLNAVRRKVKARLMRYMKEENASL